MTREYPYTAPKKALLEVATGRRRAPLVLKNATYVNVFTGTLAHADIALADGIIAGVGSYAGERELDCAGKIITPGLMDAHIHLESSLVSPREFAKAVVPHGTTTVVTDPHEIANVMGTDGISYMLQATERLPLDVFFMLPSCVPATALDEAGATLDWSAIDELYDNPRVLGLAEMMNAFGVVHEDETVLQKLTAAQRRGKLIDGHAPGLTGAELNAYIAAGVTSDHECATAEEGLEKLQAGQVIMIREGTAARNLEALAPLLNERTQSRCLFCTDDKHPSDLLEKGHIDYILRRAVELGVAPLLAVQVATWNAAQYFRLYDRGAIAPGYAADLTVFDDLKDFHVAAVCKNGSMVYSDGVLREFESVQPEKELVQKAHDTFRVEQLQPSDFPDGAPLGVIGLVPGQIVSTNEGFATAPDAEHDCLKIAVIERHRHTGHIGQGYIKGYGLRRGAVATSVSHDSHNIIVVGASAQDMAFAANRVVENRGGIVIAADGAVLAEVTLELAGLMSDCPLPELNRALEQAKAQAHALGVSEGIDPFMTLSFMSLPVIPSLRLTTRGMVDVATQQLLAEADDPQKG